MLVFDFGAILYGINYLALRQAITPDRLLGRMTATMRFLTVAAAPLGSLVGGALATGDRSARDAADRRRARGLRSRSAAVLWSPVRRHRVLPTAVLRMTRAPVAADAAAAAKPGRIRDPLRSASAAARRAFDASLDPLHHARFLPLRRVRRGAGAEPQVARRRSYRTQAPSHFTYGSHSAFFMGFTPGDASRREPTSIRSTARSSAWRAAAIPARRRRT